MPDATVLVTGASGFIGSHLVDALQERGHEVVPVDRRPNPWSKELDEAAIRLDLDRDSLEVLPTDADAVLHLAANSRVRDAMATPDQGRENLASTFHLLEWARQHDVQRFVFTSSREVYGNVADASAREAEADPRSVANPYAASKMGGEALVHAWHNGYDLDVAVARLSNVYGARDVSDRVIPTFIARAWEGLDLEIYGTGKRLDLLHVDDCIEGLLALYQAPAASGESINIGSGSSTSLDRLARAIVDRAPHDVDVEHASARQGEVDQFVADVARAEDLLDWQPRIDLDAGLDRAVDWYAENPDVRERILSEG